MASETGKNWIRYDGETYWVAPGERALDVMLRRGAPVSFSCRKGACASCMLQAVSGDPGEKAKERLSPEYQELGFFLPCCAEDISEVEAVLPDLSQCTFTASVSEKVQLAPTLIRLRLEPLTEVDWLPGQTIGLMNPDGATRRYSVVSLKADDYFLDVDLRIYPDGAVSGWVARDLKPGDEVRFQAPQGGFIYDEALNDTPLLMIGTGSGGGALLGLARDAVAKGHTGPIYLYHGAGKAEDLYLGDLIPDSLRDRITFVTAASQEPVGDQPAARVTELAFAAGHDLSKVALFLCGGPDMVEDARIRAVTAGIPYDRIHCDPFDSPVPYQPRDAEKIRQIQPDAELWEALENGEKLTRMLHEFYTVVYDDPRLAPFFHRVTKQRAIEKQYNFLQDLIHGTKLYFGEKPFNSHHWMVISDELFEYRENLFMEIARRHEIPEELLHRWAAIHEIFRREIVKSAPRGVIRNGQEIDLEGFVHEKVEVATVCDGCVGEIPAGSTVRMHRRTGEIFCSSCDNAAAA
ncbi:MAG: 2Fe-2S iron-sulfur cluster binding domain-containing protein [Rhodobacteraceae bacterium]|nr:2Fe-2S iron-sulfur cluster binding domain-containing protein [Paracoccaceae bacterium]